MTPQSLTDSCCASKLGAASNGGSRLVPGQPLCSQEQERCLVAGARPVVRKVYEFIRAGQARQACDEYLPRRMGPRSEYAQV